MLFRSGDTMWFRVNVWGEKGEALMDHIKKGDLVLVQGTFKQSTFKNKDGEDEVVVLWDEENGDADTYEFIKNQYGKKINLIKNKLENDFSKHKLQLFSSHNIFVGLIQYGHPLPIVNAISCGVLINL